MARLDKVDGRWVNLEKPGGLVVFVGGGTAAYKGIGASDTYPGLTPERPKSTLASALTKAVAGRGDTIVVLPGTITVTASVAISKADVTISGMGGDSQVKPSAITGNLTSTGDIFAVSAANVVIEDLHFNASSAANTSRINVAGAGLVVRDCTFQCGASDLETITVPAAGTDLLVSGCRFSVTANGPDAAIEIEAAGASGLTVKNCSFRGVTDTNKWDAGAIHSSSAHTGCLIDNNVFWEGLAVEFTSTATGIISRNFAGEGATLGQAFDPGSCMCFENYEADAVDESGRLFPTTAAS